MPDPRVLYLAVPSAIALGILVVHSWIALPRRRAATFWIAVLVYGLVRGLGVKAITRAIGAKFPYELHNPLLHVFGVSVQEIAGWAVVGYLAWWIGSRYARERAFAQVAIGALFLGCVSWAVEAAAVAAGWWHWNVPTASRFFLNVPPIGIVDWFFVATDFLLPFVAITTLRTPWRFATLLLFPLHFGSHALTEPLHDAVPIPFFHLVHWLLLALLLALAMHAGTRDIPFSERARSLPFVAAAIVIADIVFVLLFVVRQPRLLLAVLPLALLVGATSLRLRIPRIPWPAIVAAVLAVAWLLHARIAADRTELQRRLDGAIAARDQRQLAYATAELESLVRDFPAAHVPHALLGEIYYRTNRSAEARPLFERAFAIKQDYLDGYRYAAVIAMQSGDSASARSIARRGLDVAPHDLQLRYLAGERVSASTLEEAMTLAGLAFEVNDRATTTRVLDEAIARWPSDQRLRQMRAASTR